jgi:hypothetical protein
MEGILQPSEGMQMTGNFKTATNYPLPLPSFVFGFGILPLRELLDLIWDRFIFL